MQQVNDGGIQPKQREGPENRQMLLQPLHSSAARCRQLKYSFNNLKQFHNSPGMAVIFASRRI